MNRCKYNILKLKNGLKVLVYPQSHVNSISVSAAVRAGHISENPEENGIAHLLEHTLFDGTQEFPTYQDLTDFFDKMAGGYSGSTSLETINLFGTFVDEEMQNAFYTLEQILFHPLISEKDVAREKDVLMNELSEYEDSPDYLHFLETKKLRFKGKTILSMPPGGTSESVREINSNQIKAFHQKYFQPGNINIVIAGRCNTRDVERVVQKTFQSKENKKVAHKEFSYKQFSDKAIKILARRSKKAYIRITFPSLSWKHPSIERVALNYLCTLFSNHRASLLYSKLREKLGWIYDIGTDHYVGFDIGALEIITSTPPEKSLLVTEEILKAIKHVRTHIFDIKRIKQLVEIDRKNMKMSLDTTEDIVNWFQGEMIYRYPKIMLPKDFIEVYNEIDAKLVQKVARDVFDWKRLNICVLQQLSPIKRAQFRSRINGLIDKYSEE